MFKTIQWHAFLSVASERKVAKILERFAVDSGHEMVLQECKRYWKDAALFDVRFSTPLNSDRIADAIFRTLCICEKLTPRWTVSAPSGYDNGLWEFRGDSMNRAEGIELIYFWVDNFSNPAQGPCAEAHGY